MSSPPPPRTQDRLILALDVDSAAEARAMVDKTSPYVGCYKIGLQLFVQEGPALVRELTDAGRKVFLDLKLHDIPNTVLAAARRIAGLGASLFTVHCLNGQRSIEHCLTGLREFCTHGSLAPPTMVGVTVLTSMTDADLHGTGLVLGVEKAVENLAGQGYRAGLRTFVASAREARLIKQTFPDVFLITPGIRPAGSPVEDQSRAMTPGEAIPAGADALVIGRPILRAADPAAAARMVLEEIEQALDQSA
jgi:orotidine-5'-phosphate decarboxylase